jgi:hypothetical protein
MPPPPVLASGSRESKRPRALPKPMRDAIVLLVRGGDDPDHPLDFVEAARMVGIRPQDMRKWFDRPAFLQFLRAERKAWRAAICAGNESALKRVRDTSENGMAVIGAVRGLEDLDVAEAVQSRGTQQTPGIVINILSPARAVPTIDAQPVAALEHAPRADAEPVFDPDR